MRRRSGDLSGLPLVIPLMTGVGKSAGAAGRQQVRIPLEGETLGGTLHGERSTAVPKDTRQRH